ncbi:MAG: glycosyltransferase family 4 protein [Deltaproteobacteria bacterium]|nr:glycosyltransferase family 4 protein [Deltaproteobacteria bacterium]
MTNPIVAIDALSAISGGGLSVARGLCESLAVARPTWTLLMIASHDDALPSPSPANVEPMRPASAQSTLRRWRFEQVALPRVFSRRDVGAVLLLGGFKIFASDCPQAAVWQNAHIWTPTVASHGWKLSAYIALQKIVMRATVSRVGRNVFLSADSADRCRRSIDLPETSVEIAPIGIDARFYSNTALPRPFADRDPYLLAVGDVYAHKRFELAIEALAALGDRGAGIELRIAGRILDPPYHARLVDRIEQSGLHERVRFLGHVPRERLIELYGSGLALITSSRLETFGLTPIEAMACGLPVVACAESAVPEVCGDGADYASEATGVALAQQLERLLSNPADWQDLQRRGLERSRRFAWPVVAERYARILESLIGIPSPEKGDAMSNR